MLMRRQIALACFAALLVASSTRAAVTVHHYYRMGENDSGQKPGVAFTTRDVAGTKDITWAGGPFYSTAVSSEAAARVGSVYSMDFFSTGGPYGSATLLTNVTDNFGVEAWIYPTTTSGSHVMFYNGDPGSSGWGIRILNGTYEILFGGVIFTGGGVPVANTWTHVALVRASGVANLYVNGVSVINTALAPNPAVGTFSVGATPGTFTDPWPGLLDEVRFFTFAAGQFSMNDLLRLAPDIAVQQPAGSAVADGGSRDFGSATVGGNATLNFTVTNSGVSGLSGLGITIDGTDAAQFSVTASPAATVAAGGSTTFSIRFAPTTNGNKTAALHLTSNDPEESPYDITLTGSGVGPEIGVFSGANTSPANERVDNTGFQFPNTNVGESAPQTFTITNTGNAPLTGLAVTKTGSSAGDFTLGTLGATTLAPGASTTFTVTFIPTTTGLRAAEILLANNDSNENPFNIIVIGTGVLPEIAVFTGAGTAAGAERTDNSGTHNFADTVVGGSSTAQTFTITNKGDGNLSGLAVSKSGLNPGDFTLSGLGATTLAPNAATTFTVTFSPTVTGVRNAVVSIASNDGDENPFEINVSGAGVSSEISVEQPAGTPLFTGQAQGWGWNLIGQTTIPPLGQFGIRAIASRESTTLALRNDGTVIGWGYGVTNGGPYPVPAGLTGAKAVAVGSSHYLVLKNDGALVAWGNDIQGTSLASAPTGMVAIAAGAGFNVALKNDGTVVAWGNNGSGRTNVPPGLAGVMAIAVGNFHTLALKSNGTVVAWGDNGVGQTNVPAGLTNVIAIGAGGSHSLAAKSDGTVVGWGLNGDGQATAPASASNVVAVTGGANHSLALRSDGKVIAWGLNSIGETTVPASVTGAKAIAAGSYFSVAAYDSAIDFGNQFVGSTSAAKTFTVKNTGPAALNITNVSIVGLNASDFTVNTAGMLASVPATSGQTTFSVTFNPNAAGLRAARLRVLSSDSDENPYEIFLTGTGIPAQEISVFTGAGTAAGTERTDNVGTNVFAATDVGSSSAAQTFTITNTGAANLTGLAVSKSGSHPGDFTLSALGATTLAPNASTTFAVAFAPTTSGTRHAVIAIASNDGDENPFEINVSGVARVPDIAVEQPTGTPLTNGASRDFGSGIVGTNIALTFSVQNSGNANLILSGLPPVTISGAHATDFTVTAQPVSPVPGIVLDNGGFESPVLDPGAYTYGPSSPGWTFGSSAGIARNGSPWFVNSAPEGAQAAYIQRDGTEAYLSQSVNFSSAGNYLIRFSLVRRAFDYPANDVDVRMDGVSLGTNFNTSQPDDVWRTFEVQYQCTNAGNHLLAFVGLRGEGDYDSALDNVHIVSATTFEVTFTPTAGGPRTATLSIPSNDPDESPFEITLTGTGHLPLGPEMAVFTGPGTTNERTNGVGTNGFAATIIGSNSTAQIFTITNTGSASLSNIFLTRSGPHANDFVPGALGTNTLAPNSSTTFTVAFTPTADGTRTAVISIASNDDDENPFEINVAGIGLGTPDILVEQPGGNPLTNGASKGFGSVFVGASANLTFSIGNSGSGDLLLTGTPRVQITGADASEFTVVEQPDSPVFGKGGAVTLTNGGFEAPVLSANGFSYATAGSGWSMGSSAGIARNGSPWFVNAAPEGAQAMFIQTNSVGSVVSRSVNFSATGNYVLRFAAVRRSAAIPANDLEVRFDGVAIGSVTNTSQPDDTWRYFNIPFSCSTTGSHVLAFVGLRGGADYASAVDNVQVLGGTPFQVVFTPIAAGARTATLSITNNDSDESPFEISLTGTGVITTEISVFTGATTNSANERVDNVGTNVFSNLATGFVSTATFTIKNMGNTNLTGLALSKLGANPDEFTVSGPGTNNLAANATTTFTIAFAPTNLGVRSATIALASNDEDENPFEIHVRGTGLLAPEIAVFNGASTNAADERVDNVGTNVFAAPLGSSNTMTFTIKNVGFTNLTGIAVSKTGANPGEFLLGVLGTNNLTTNATTTFTVTFAPTNTGFRSATVQITSNDGDESPFDIRVAGTVLVPDIALEHPVGRSLFAGRIVAWGAPGQTKIPAGLTDAQTVAVGNAHAMALKPDGTVVSWGSTNFGLLNAPADVTNVQAIAAGIGHSVALRSDGTLVSWGRTNNFPTNVPPGLTNVVAIAAGGDHSIALKRDGTVSGWGFNGFGESGSPTIATNLAAIAAGYNHNVGLRSNGVVIAWGYNASGQSTVPAGLTNARAVACGQNFSVALRSNGTVVAWGANNSGQTSVPAGLSNVVAIAAGLEHAVALQSNGNVVVWGRNLFGQTNVPAGLTNVFAIFGGGDVTMAFMDSLVVFGPQSVATASEAKTITIRNTGGAPLTITNVTLLGSHASDFALDTNGTPASLAAGSEVAIAVTFTPSVVGARTATLRVTSNDPDENPFEILVVGTGGIAPEISVSGNGVNIANGNSTPGVADHTDFGSANLTGSNVVRTFTITNIGSAVLTLGSVTVSGTNAADFIVNVQPAANLVAGDSTTFQITFTPGAAGLRSATLSFTNNDTDESPYHFTLAGTGEEAVPLPPTINTPSPTVLGGGVFQLNFANTNNATFSVLASTNISLPASNWTVLGTATNLGGGLYQFTDPDATNYPSRYYKLRFP